MRTVRYDKYTKYCSECQHQYTISCVYSSHAKRPLIVACTVNSLFVGNPGSDTFVLFFEISVSDGNIDIGFFPQVTLQIKLSVIKNVSAVVKPVVENKAPCLFFTFSCSAETSDPLGTWNTVQAIFRHSRSFILFLKGMAARAFKTTHATQILLTKARSIMPQLNL